jgi:hypothetical protein
MSILQAQGQGGGNQGGFQQGLDVPFFSLDPLSSSANLGTIDGDYSDSGTGLERTASDAANFGYDGFNSIDRPMVKTAFGDYLNTDFIAELTVKRTVTDGSGVKDLIYFGFGEGLANSSYNNEPTNSIFFRIHSSFGYYGVDAAYHTGISTPGWVTGTNIDNIGTYNPTGTTFRIEKIGNSVTLSIVGGGSLTYSVSDLGGVLNTSNSYIFFGNSALGTIFTSLTVSPINQPPVADAGADQLVESLSGSENISLDGTGSDDPDGDILSYSWVLNGFEESTNASFSTTLGFGVHTFTLTVDDGNGETDTDDVVISIIDPMIAHWKAEGNGLDETANNNHVTTGGASAVTYGIGADGQGFEFTGSNWMEIADNPTLDIGTGDLAIVMWAKLSGANGIETLLDKRDPNDGWKGYVVYTIDNGFVGAQINTGGAYTNWISPINIADNQWHHIVFTIDRDNPTGGYITVDGTQTYTFDPTAYMGDVNNDGPLRIGGRNDGVENWVGSIDDVRLYNHAFTPQ